MVTHTELVEKLQYESSLLQATLTERENENAILKRELEQTQKGIFFYICNCMKLCN